MRTSRSKVAELLRRSPLPSEATPSRLTFRFGKTLLRTEDTTLRRRFFVLTLSALLRLFK